MIESKLKQYFGFEKLRKGQSEVIHHILNGDSAAAIFPTGAGKSLCYQLPALFLPHLTLVISPLLALIKDQLDFLHSKGISAASIDSTQERVSMQQVMQRARNGELKILMISVERLKNERFRQFISQIPISLLVVDEAHCISEWGHNFRPDYLKLPYYRQQLNIPQVLLLTATATSNVIEDMCGKFGIHQDAITVTGFYRSNLTLDVLPCIEEQKFEQLLQLINRSKHAPTIVYVTLQNTAETIADRLKNSGIQAIAYHAGLDNEYRESIQRKFMQGLTTCIVATIAFGMGIDKSDIRQVIHYDLPKSIENYAQEIGRAGRDGQRSTCTILANADNVNVLENFIFGDTPDKCSIEYVVDQIYSSEGDWEFSINQLSSESNIRTLPLKTLLVYLELNNVIESKYSYYASYKFKFIDDAKTIIDRFQGERRSFVETIFQCSPQAKIWCSIDFDALWLTYSANRKRVIAAVDYFHEKGWIELESKQTIDVYKVLSKEAIKHALVDNIFELFSQKEKNEILRIQQMLDFFQSEQCLSHSLAHYFSDGYAPTLCHHCSVCAGKVAKFPERKQVPIDINDVKNWIKPYQEANLSPLSTKALGRFLCGITTPLSIKLKAKRMIGFGKLEAYPFNAIINILDEMN